jgi:hypothetical protein
MSDYYASKELVDRAKAYSSLRDSAVGIIRDLAKATPLPTDAEPRASSALLEAARTPSGAPLFAHPWLSSCPDCGADLDTGWECTDCEKDWQPLHQIVAAIKAEKARGPSEPVSDPFKFKEPDAYKQTELPEEFCAWLTGTWRGERGLWRVMSAEQTDQLVDFVRGLCKERDEASDERDDWHAQADLWTELYRKVIEERDAWIARAEKAEAALAAKPVADEPNAKLLELRKWVGEWNPPIGDESFCRGHNQLMVLVTEEIDRLLASKPVADEPKPEPIDLYTAKRNYKFRLELSETDRCRNCVHVRHHKFPYDGQADCSLLDIHVSNTRKSRCQRHEPKPASDVASAETDWHPILTKWLQRRDEGHPCSPEDLGAMVATLVRIELARGVK